MSNAHPRDRLPRLLGPWDASMLVVASVVGSGIFFTPAQVALLLPSAPLIVAAWLAGAALSLAGAFANAELGAMYPRAGGDYVYLREAFHPAVGFAVGGLSFFAIYAGTIAALAVVFAESVATGWGLDRSGVIGLATTLIVACSVLNLRGTSWAAQVNNWASGAKIVALLAFVLLGPVVGAGSFAPWTTEVSRGAAVTSGGNLALRFGQAMSPVLFSFLGWNASVYVASEIKDPARNVPRSLFLGLAICTVLYLLVNAVYLYALTPLELRTSVDTGEAAAFALFGSAGGRLVGIFVLVSVLGTLNATVIVGPRIVYAMALDGLFWSTADRIHERFKTPAAAILVQALVAITLVFFLETFPRALDFTVFAIVLATSADTLALFVLRRREPGRERPYRAWGYPWLPVLYLAVNLAVGVAIAIARPAASAVTLGLLAGSLLIYWRIAPPVERGDAAISS